MIITGNDHGDKQELYMDVYKKATNECIREE